MKARLPEGFGGGGNLNSMLKQAQKMQEDVAKVQAELEQREYRSSVGGGVVELVMSGKKEVVSLKIMPEVIDPSDADMLQDLIISAFNDAVRQVEDASASEMGKVTGGMNIPGMF